MMILNKNVLITGTNRGIGLALVKAFANEGANVLAHARKKTPEFVEEMNELSKKYNVKIEPVYFELTDSNAMKETIKLIVKSKTKIDILVNNAGIAHGGLFQMTSINNIREIFDVNFFSVVELTQLVARIMTRQKSGNIINISSISGIDLKAGNCAYGTSKAALIALTKTLSAELAPQGIRVNVIAPGLTSTNMARLMENKAGEEMTRETALDRLARPEEIAQVATFLASEKSSFITGQVIRVDGGAK